MPSNNFFLTPPERYENTDIEGLPVTIDKVEGVMYSYWQPTETDIANILAGVPIRLAVLGTRDHLQDRSDWLKKKLRVLVRV